MKRIYLNNNWKYNQANNSAEWKEATVPGNIHLDLLIKKEIPTERIHFPILK